MPQYHRAMTFRRVMSPWRPLPFLAVLLAATPALAQLVPLAPPPPPRMTSESPEYCAHLGAEFGRALRNHPQASAESRMLADEGTRLCARGHLRAGIMRLRKALRMVRTGN